MQVVLLERVEKLGQMGDVVTVKPGFARNFLLPQSKALRATKDNLAHFEGQKAQLQAHNLSKKTEAEGMAKQLEGKKFVIIRQAAEAGQLFGSVNARDIADSVTEGGVTLSRNQVRIEQPIKMLGLFPVKVALHPEVVVSVTVNVARSPEEAEAQFKAGGAIKKDLDADEPVAAPPAAAMFDNAPVPGTEDQPDV